MFCFWKVFKSVKEKLKSTYLGVSLVKCILMLRVFNTDLLFAYKKCFLQGFLTFHQIVYFSPVCVSILPQMWGKSVALQ